MSEEAVAPSPQPRRRSNSLPIPQIEISVYQGPTSRDSPTGSSITKDFIEIPEPPSTALLTGKFISPGTSLRKTEAYDKFLFFLIYIIQYPSLIFAENPDSPLLSRRMDDLPAVGPTAVRRSSEKKRRVKMADLRTLIETRMFSKSERTLEKVGLESTLHEKPLEQSVSIFFYINQILGSKVNRLLNLNQVQFI